MFRESWQIPSPFMSDHLEEQFAGGNSIVKLPQNSEKNGIFGGIQLYTTSLVKNHLALILSQFKSY